MVREHQIESRLVTLTERAGGKCFKYHPDSQNGMPDRLCVFPGGVHVWVETKKPRGGKVEALQKHMHRMLRELGADVEVCWTEEDAERIVRTYSHT